ncbi:ClpXP protease specificity-enhancing factor [Thalassotalea mangrovi]|uniref:ClpXP protease specificity-enhancing factor n=1 Tax=Thalassotalea mangrovi TaxID=2572245 RepID=A0A4U1BCJ0_9GAMM|nr:ClpXP protease specificity-enhancing factor [Thalassotalea mangrovi]TKB47914.1 ClpXP protease specificity-enhancing factor [Thalassotalea mangrovi]
MTSNKPYLLRAFFDWIVDNQLTPYISVDALYPGVNVPQAYVTDGQIVLNIAPVSVGGFAMGQEQIEFNARFGGKLEHLIIPNEAVAAIYARENGVGTSFEVNYPELAEAEESTTESQQKPPKKGKPSLSIVK